MFFELSQNQNGAKFLFEFLREVRQKTLYFQVINFQQILDLNEGG